MGHIKDIKSNLDPQTFPGATFEIEGESPAAQCSEAKIESIAGTIEPFSNFITETGKFTGYALTGKQVTVVLPLTEAGTYAILFNDSNAIQTDHEFQIADNAVEYYVHDGGELILTRNVKSFAQYIHAAAYAYTIKGGKLYTDMPSGSLKNACTILFDPLT